MPMKVADRVLETSGTTGSGALSLAGAKTGYQTFVAGIGNGNTCPYLITDGTDWEVGIGTVSSGAPDQLSRDQVIASSNGNIAVPWSTGTRDVAVVSPAAFFASPGAHARSISSAATLTVKDNGHVLLCTSAFTQALPALADVFEGWGIWIKPDPGIAITLDGDGSETIDGASTYSVRRPTLVVAGPSEWEVVVGDAARIATGTYTGDGSTSLAVTGVGFKPKYVKIWPRVTTDNQATSIYETSDTVIDDNAAGMAFVHFSTGNHVTRVSGIIAFGDDGFTVDDAGSDAGPNSSAVVYNYLAIG